MLPPSLQLRIPQNCSSLFILGKLNLIFNFRNNFTREKSIKKVYYSIMFWTFCFLPLIVVIHTNTMKTKIAILLAYFFQMTALLVAQTPLYDLGQFYPEFQEYANSRPMSYSWLSKDWPELEQWRIQGRAKMMELLSYSPEPVPLNPEITEKVRKTWLHPL